MQAMPKILLYSFLLSFVLVPVACGQVDQGKTLDLKYTSIDGKTVDLSKMRGKVVLVDFWATWCPVCVDEMPSVVAIYKKYHDRGFEIVGVSLNEDKGEMLSFMKAAGMVWPQYFDGRGWDNKISTRFDVDVLPTMWLVGRDGKVVSTDASYDLGVQVENALKAP